MNLKLLAVGSFVVMVSLLAAGICLVIYFVRRERRQLDRIQKMIEDAVEGKFEEGSLDESRRSAVETSMWRYLCHNQMNGQELLKEKEQIQMLISDIAHQTVTPIANISLYSQLLEEWEEKQAVYRNPEIMEGVAALREQAEKLDFLVESLVKLSRLETGIIKVVPKRQPVGPVLAAVRNQYIPKAAKKGIQFNVELSEDMALYDMKWTIEAVANIVDNAIKYTSPGGKVSIHVVSYSFFVRIDVKDNGIGIPEPEQAQIFTRFYRCAAAHEKPGVGIGLYLAREVMRAQDGYIKLNSREGEGSLFSLFFLTEKRSQK